MNFATNGCTQLYTEKYNGKSGNHATEVFDCTDYTVVLDRLNKYFE